MTLFYVTLALVMFAGSGWCTYRCLEDKSGTQAGLAVFLFGIGIMAMQFMQTELTLL